MTVMQGWGFTYTSPTGSVNDPNITFVGGPAVDAIKQNFPQFAPLLMIPGVGAVILRGVYQGLSPNQFMAAIANTDWYKNTPDTARNLFMLKMVDPATYRQQLANQAYTMQLNARKLGLSIPLSRLESLAERAALEGWSAERLLAEMAKAGGGFSDDGTIAGIQNQLGATARNYGIKMGSGTLGQWATDIAMGIRSQEGFNAYVAKMAKSAFPSLAGAIDAGMSVRDIADPYFQMAAAELEIPISSIDLYDPKWTRPLQGKSLMTLYDWQRMLRNDPKYGYDYTNGARAQAVDIATTFARTFGGIG